MTLEVFQNPLTKIIQFREFSHVVIKKLTCFLSLCTTNCFEEIDGTIGLCCVNYVAFIVLSLN